MGVSAESERVQRALPSRFWSEGKAGVSMKGRNRKSNQRDLVCEVSQVELSDTIELSTVDD
jgi:hypothetical protein